MSEEIKFKSDKYRKSRGGYSRFLEISCEHCGHKILIYQKDGSGELRRLYIDRILKPKSFSIIEKKPINKISQLTCPNCKRVLGVPYIFEKENRKAFRLFVGAITKKITKLK